MEKEIQNLNTIQRWRKKKRSLEAKIHFGSLKNRVEVIKVINYTTCTYETAKLNAIGI
jgi:hypothetical protein